MKCTLTYFYIISDVKLFLTIVRFRTIEEEGCDYDSQK